ncbi:AsmA family protein [Achromobacter sp. SD115]|uniref:AsmA family protein n=1 Tax=Achromobacter sp. SD115 TaxID=2782011 RepID=UPI001A97BCCF|nr:AsmA family protein [Achromobacter sp. SD115]MBO1017195.1 AsmA family protein [Achromobacter sp. SD115]
MTRSGKIAIGIVGGAALLVAVLVVVIATFDWNRAKPFINERASAAIGRPFAINGDLSVEWGREPDEGGWRAWVPWPHIVANDISVGNAPWAKAPQFATLKRGELSLALLPLLGQRVVIRRIQLTEPAADLERLADGRANWEFTLPETGEPSPWVLDINEIGFDKGRVGLVDQVLKADLTVLVDPLGKPVPFADVAGATFAAEEGGAAPSPRDYVFGWKLDGKYKGLATKGEGKVGGMLALQDASQPFPVQADVAIGGTRASVAGTLTDPVNLGALDLRLKLSGASMAQLYPLTGVTLPDTPPYSTDGHLVAKLRNPGGAVFDYKGFNGKVGNSDLHGDISFALGMPRPKLTGKLSSKQLRMEDLGPLIGVPSGKVAGAATDQAKDAPAKPKGGKVLPTQAFRTDRWRDMDADVSLDAGRIVHDSKLPLSDLSVHLVLQDGKLALEPLRFGMAGGNINSTIRLDGSGATLTGRVDISARRLRLKQLFPATAAMQKTLGELNGDMAVSGAGNSVAALLGTATGDVKMLVNDGVISRSLMEIAGLNVGNYVVSKLFGDDEVKINCGAADLEMKSGVMTPRVFVFDTENALISITGTADFKNEKLDMDITPDSKGFRIFSLRSPLYVRGTFGSPDVGVHVLPLAARGAGMVALGVLLTPAAGLLALVAPSTTDENACGPLLEQMRKPPKAPAPATAKGK